MNTQGEAVILETIPERVQRGAAWLDRVRPGWRDSITPSLLIMHDGCKCICGQVFEHEAMPFGDGYGWAQTNYADDRHWEVRHGFTLAADERGEYAERWADLKAEWLRVIGIPSKPRERAHV